MGAGTEAVEDELQQRYPDARIERWDSDVVRDPLELERAMGRSGERRGSDTGWHADGGAWVGSA